MTQKTLMDREDWKDMTKAMKIIAEKFNVGVYCSQKYSYLNVEFKTNGMPNQEEVWALEQLEVMVMTASDQGS